MDEARGCAGRLAGGHPLALGLAVLITPATLAAQRIVGLPSGGWPEIWPVGAASIATFLLVLGWTREAVGGAAALNRRCVRLRDELSYQARHDPLTGLPNRTEATRLIAAALRRGGAAVGLVVLDIDGFGNVNERFGHRAGDEVLRATGARLRFAGNAVTRLGADSFAVLLESADSEAAATIVAGRCLAAVSEPIECTGGAVRVRACAGVAVRTDAMSDAETLLSAAEVAAGQARLVGPGSTVVVDSALRTESAQHAELQAALRTAIAGDELVLHHQPIGHLRSGRIQGYEALVCWDRPGFGLLPLEEFARAAASAGISGELGGWVLREAAGQLARWNRDASDDELFLSVDVSVRHVATTGFVADVAAVLNAARVDARQLVLEVAEAAFGDPAAVRNLREVRGLGVAVAIDGFGADSIPNLAGRPVDMIKIDGRYLTGEPVVTWLLQAIVEAAHTYDLRLVAMGVDSAEQGELARFAECESAQGSCLGRPMGPAETELHRFGRPAATSAAVSSREIPAAHR